MKILLLACFVLAAACASGQQKILNSITENDLEAHLGFIASDQLQGRNFFTEVNGLGIAASYLKSQIQIIGLKPGAEDYSQVVEMVSTRPDPENTYIGIKNASGAVVKNHSVCGFTASPEDETMQGEVVFAGYGWTDSKTGYNDLEGVDLKDKIVMIMSRNPQAVADTSGKGIDELLEMGKLSPIFKSGAKAIIFAVDPLNQDTGFYQMVQRYTSQGRFSLKSENREPIPFPGKYYFIGNSLADELLKDENTTLEQLQKKINETGKPSSFLIKDVTAELHFGKITTNISGENVIGIIEGSDPELKNECVVLTAHYDHLGVDDSGQVFNGADDNASGAAVLLEIADAFSKLKKKPARSIVFAWVTAEEKGLIGSKYYTQNPVFPLAKTVACLNFDMVGRVAPEGSEIANSQGKELIGREGIYLVTGNKSTGLDKISDEVGAKIGLKPDRSMADMFLSGSDHYHFYKNGIPVVGVSTGLHADYHTTSDDIEKLDFAKMKKVAEFGFLVAYKVANDKNQVIKK